MIINTRKVFDISYLQLWSILKVSHNLEILSESFLKDEIVKNRTFLFEASHIYIEGDEGWGFPISQIIFLPYF